MTQEEHLKKWSRGLTVDHIDGRGRNHRREDKNNTLENLQTLCLSCHGRKDIWRRRDFVNIKANPGRKEDTK